MTLPNQTPRIIRFGVFEVDLQEGELRKSGLRIKLQEQPFQVLVILLECPGKIVTRDELRQRLWPADTFVDFDHSLNSAVKKMREALGDQPDNSRFIETLHRRGYRFIASVEDGQPAAGMKNEPQRDTKSALVRPSPAEEARRNVPSRLAPILAAVAVIILSAILVSWWTSQPETLGVQNYTQITNDGADKATVFSVGSVPPPIVTDGSRLYFTEGHESGSAIGEVSLSGGETALVSTPFSNAVVAGISPGGADLLFYTFVSSEIQVPFWTIPALGGSPRRVGSFLAQDATWSPDGQIIYTRDHDIYTCNPDGSESRKVVSVRGLPAWPRWSPDGEVLRFSEYDPKKNSTSVWEVSRDGSNHHPVLPAWNGQATECCGSWTPDQKYFIFQSKRDGRNDIWAVRAKERWWQKASQKPVQLTAGPMSFSRPVVSKDGKRIFVLGEKLRGELVLYDGKANQFVPYLAGVSAVGLAFSRDGNWVSYVAYPEGTLWRSKADGSERLQLTFSPFEAVAPRWSPDGKRIAFTGRKPGQAWKVYVIPSEPGSSPQAFLEGEGSQAAPDWSPDGNSIAYGGFPEVMSGAPRATAVYVLNLTTHESSLLNGSEGLYCPRWSPDGRYISATKADGRELMLYDSRTGKWTDLTELSGGCPTWSREGTHLYFQTFDVKDPAVFRVRIADRKRERIANINLRRDVQGAEWEWWNGLTPDDAPILMRDMSTKEIYGLDLQFP
jgi:Tol biopolymer transport system component/DNA-binding winged helix-turn-helix (wHTH) protein